MEEGEEGGEEKVSEVEAGLERASSRDWLEKGHMAVEFSSEELYNVLEESSLVPFLEV